MITILQYFEKYPPEGLPFWCYPLHLSNAELQDLTLDTWIQHRRTHHFCDAAQDNWSHKLTLRNIVVQIKCFLTLDLINWLELCEFIATSVIPYQKVQAYHYFSLASTEIGNTHHATNLLTSHLLASITKTNKIFDASQPYSTVQQHIPRDA